MIFCIYLWAFLSSKGTREPVDGFALPQKLCLNFKFGLARFCCVCHWSTGTEEMMDTQCLNSSVSQRCCQKIFLWLTLELPFQSQQCHFKWQGRWAEVLGRSWRGVCSHTKGWTWLGGVLGDVNIYQVWKNFEHIYEQPPRLLCTFTLRKKEFSGSMRVRVGSSRQPPGNFQLLTLNCLNVTAYMCLASLIYFLSLFSFCLKGRGPSGERFFICWFTT